MNETMLDIFRRRAERICEDGVRLLGQFSGMHPVNTPGDSFVVLNPNGDQFWNDLTPVGKQIQTQLLPEIDRFTDLVCTLTQDLPSDSQQNMKDVLKKIRSAVEQNGSTWWKTNDEAIEGFRNLIKQVITMLEDYYGTSLDVTIAIPDTNAFLGNPDIEHWQFENTNHFTIILTPTVLSELDKHKINHRNQAVRDNASKVIRKIKEYRRRGSLHEGVVVVNDRVSLQSIASEPNMSQSLSWFDSSNADDRFLATTVEVIRNNLGARVFIVTSDINMQNKAEMAGIPFREVPAQRTEQESS
jgi:rRNA maturation endonuclease Nob1